MCICVERIDVIGYSFYAIFINYTSRRLITRIFALAVARQPLKEEPSEPTTNQYSADVHGRAQRL